MRRFYLSPICQVAELIRKPALPLPFAEQTERVKRLANELEHASGSSRKIRGLQRELVEEQRRLTNQVCRYFDRQRQYPWNYAMEVPDVDGLVPFDQDGLLPPAIYHAEWAAVVERYGYTPRRRQLLNGLLATLHLLKKAGAQWVRVGGSFVTAKRDPGDIDCEWDNIGLDTNILEPMLRDGRDPLATIAVRNWTALRRQYFGLDVSFSTDYFLRRGFFDCPINLPDELRGFPLERAVGMLHLDLSGELPQTYLDCEKFVPFSMWPQPIGEMLPRERLDELRQRLPEHWDHVSDEELRGMGVNILRRAYI